MSSGKLRAFRSMLSADSVCLVTASSSLFLQNSTMAELEKVEAVHPDDGAPKKPDGTEPASTTEIKPKKPVTIQNADGLQTQRIRATALGNDLSNTAQTGYESRFTAPVDVLKVDEVQLGT